MGLRGKAQHAGERDIGMANAFAEQIRRLHRRTLFVQDCEHARDLRLAALDPELERLLAQYALIEKADGLVAESGRERAEPQLPPSLSAMGCDHCFRLTHELVEMIQ